MAKGDKTQEGGGAQPSAERGCHRCRAQYAHTTCTIRANYAHSTTGNLSSEGPRPAARHRPVAAPCRTSLSLPRSRTPPSSTGHSAQCTGFPPAEPLHGAPTPYRIVQGCTGCSPIGGGCNSAQCNSAQAPLYRIGVGCNSCAALIAGCRCRAGGGRKHLQPCIRTESRPAALELRWQLQSGSRALDRTKRRRVVHFMQVLI